MSHVPVAAGYWRTKTGCPSSRASGWHCGSRIDQGRAPARSLRSRRIDGSCCAPTINSAAVRAGKGIGWLDTPESSSPRQVSAAFAMTRASVDGLGGAGSDADVWLERGAVATTRSPATAAIAPGRPKTTSQVSLGFRPRQRIRVAGSYLPRLLLA